MTTDSAMGRVAQPASCSRRIEVAVMRVCYKCFQTNPTLAALFKAKRRRGKCDACKRVRASVLDTDQLAPLFAGLQTVYAVAERGIHYVIAEEDRLGDEGALLRERLRNDWSVFSEELDEDMIEQILDEVWPEQSGQFFASEEFGDRPAAGEWESIKRHIKHERRFFVSDDDLDFTPLPSLLQRFKDRLPVAELRQPWVRARVQKDRIWRPDEMRHPPSESASPGRANPAGISYLYIASDVQTACAEIRAEPGHHVTIADVRLPESLKILDLVVQLRRIDPFAYADLRTEIEARNLLRAFALDLSRPVLAEDAPIDYIPTQYVAEYFASVGFDGIQYRSSVADGNNVVLFSPKHAEVTSTRTARVLSKTLRIRDVTARTNKL